MWTKRALSTSERPNILLQFAPVTHSTFTSPSFFDGQSRLVIPTRYSATLIVWHSPLAPLEILPFPGVCSRARSPVSRIAWTAGFRRVAQHGEALLPTRR